MLGLVFALWALNLLVKSAPVDLPRLNEVHLDGRVLLFRISRFRGDWSAIRHSTGLAVHIG